MLIEELESLRDGIHPLKLDMLRAAIRGQAIPEALSHELACKCLVAGIRHHDGFAVEIRGKSGHHSIERAFNARDIMSGRVPEMKKPEDVPYCFWYPDVPGQDILRRLLKDHPTVLMRYQVGRACAVGGYVELYKELDILPDVSIAEEARDNLPVSQDIYELVMNSPILYQVMDDYNRCLFDNPKGEASLNGDTCVWSTLDKRQPIHYEAFPPPFDIAEDWCLGADGKRLEDRPIPTETLSLLYTPLPRHLPWLTRTYSFSWLRLPEMLTATPGCEDLALSMARCSA